MKRPRHPISPRKGISDSLLFDKARAGVTRLCGRKNGVPAKTGGPLVLATFVLVGMVGIAYVEQPENVVAKSGTPSFKPHLLPDILQQSVPEPLLSSEQINAPAHPDLLPAPLTEPKPTSSAPSAIAKQVEPATQRSILIGQMSEAKKREARQRMAEEIRTRAEHNP